jgi:hypothetical protein
VSSNPCVCPPPFVLPSLGASMRDGVDSLQVTEWAMAGSYPPVIKLVSSFLIIRVRGAGGGMGPQCLLRRKPPPSCTAPRCAGALYGQGVLPGPAADRHARLVRQTRAACGASSRPALGQPPSRPWGVPGLAIVHAAPVSPPWAPWRGLVGWWGHDRLHLVAVQHAKADFQRHLILRNGAIFQQPPQFRDLKPA